MSSLLQPPNAGPLERRTPQRLQLLTPDRRPWQLDADGGIWLGDVPVGPSHLGSWLDALLNLARPTMWLRVPSEVACRLADRLVAWLSAPGPQRDELLERLRWEGATDAALAVLWRMQQESADPSFLDERTPRLRALALSSVGHALQETLDGAPPDDHTAALHEQIDWLLSPRVSFFSQQDEYELTWPDVALMWCGLSRAVDSDAFEWFKTGHIIFHMHAPDGPHISSRARSVWTHLLARHPGPSAFRGWHDEVAAVVPTLRNRANGHLEAGETPSATGRPTHGEIHLSTTQRARFRPWLNHPSWSEALATAASWLASAHQAGALAPSVEHGLHRACLHAAGWDAGMHAEQSHGTMLTELGEALDAAHWTGEPVRSDTLLTTLHDIHRKHLVHPEDAGWIGAVLADHPHSDLAGSLPRFIEASEGAVRWSALDPWLQGWRWHLGPSEAAAVGTTDLSVWLVAQGLVRSPAEHLQAVELVQLLEASLPFLAAAQADTVAITHAPDLVHALTWHTAAGWWVLDSAGRLQRAEPPASIWFEARLEATRATLLPGTRPEGRLPHLLHPGDVLLLPQIGWRLLSEVPHAGPWSWAHPRSGHLLHHAPPALPPIRDADARPAPLPEQVAAQHGALTAPEPDMVLAEALGAAFSGEAPQGRWILSDGTHLAPAPDGSLDVVHPAPSTPSARRLQRVRSLKTALHDRRAVHT